eukprot:1194073-Prorocentrum_minimum.AAC.2
MTCKYGRGAITHSVLANVAHGKPAKRRQSRTNGDRMPRVTKCSRELRWGAPRRRRTAQSPAGRKRTCPPAGRSAWSTSSPAGAA